MAEISRPWNGTTVGDAGPYSDQNWHELYQYIIGLGGSRNNVGVFLGSGNQPSDGLRVTEQSPAAAAINVLPGSALVRGIAYINDDTEPLTITANAAGNPRIDTIIVSADFALQTCRLAVKQGTAAVTPAPPALTQTDGVLWEIPVADIAVANGFSTITQSNITPRQEWINASPGVYLDHVLNNSGADLTDGTVVVWDGTTYQAVTTTTVLDDKTTAGIWRGRTANGFYGRVQTKGLGYVRATTAVTVGNLLTSSTTVGQAIISAGANKVVIGRAVETTASAGLVLTNIDVHMVRDEEYILIRDERANNTAPASVTAAGWRQRELNTEVFDTGNFAAVSGNQITLEPGTYEVDAGAALAGANNHRVRLQNITGGATLVEGTNEANGGTSRLKGQFTITVQSVLQLQQYPSATTTGGVALNSGDTEKYAYVYLVRKAETP